LHFLLLSLPVIKMYINHYLAYKELINKEEFERYADSGLVKTHTLSIIRENTPPEVYERYVVDYLWGNTLKN